MAGRVLPIVTLGVLLVAITFGVMALNFKWAKLDEDGASGANGGFGAFTLRTTFDGQNEIRMPYTLDAFDDLDGVGMARAGGVLFLIGILVTGLATLTAEHAIVLGRNWLNVATLSATGLAAILVVVGLILLPLGIAEFAKSPEMGGAVDIKWVFGLYAGIITAAAGLSAAVLSTITVLKSSGFRLELADATPADFDG